jgi:DNA (cytosine-5)-methyltransferase 1
MRVLNLYSGLGGNRRAWKHVEVTAVEIREDIAAVYQDLFPDDTVIVGDAHAYLLEHFNEFDFVWSSPPCQSHSRIRQFVGVQGKGYKPIYPNMALYEEIIFLLHNANRAWVVENVNPYYTPLITPTVQIGRHLIWSNFPIPPLPVKPENLRERNAISEVESLRGLDLAGYVLAGKDAKRQALRNCVDANIGSHVLGALRRTLESGCAVATHSSLP